MTEMTSDNVAPQPPPKENGSPAIWDLVIADMRARDDFGRAKYNMPLQPHNGRDALADAYQEALDLCAYLRQAIYERDNLAYNGAVIKSSSIGVLHMEKLFEVLQSRKFWSLVASLVTIWGAYYSGGVTVVEAVQATVAALGLYSVGTGLEASAK